MGQNGLRGNVGVWRILLKKSFRGGDREFLEPLLRLACGQREGPYRFIQNRSRTSVRRSY